MPADNEAINLEAGFWYISRQGKIFGPYDREKMGQYMSHDGAGPGDLVWRPTKGQWVPFDEVAPLFEKTAMPQSAQQLGSALAGSIGYRQRGPGFFAKFKRMFMIIINPGGLLKGHLQHYSWFWALSVSGLAFMLFFFQTSLDLFRAGEAGTTYMAAMTFTGILYGTLGVTAFALLAWLLVRAWGSKHKPQWAVKAFGLGYAPALVYTFCGLLANLFLGWNTAVAFGIPGVLWATRPMMGALKEMTGGKKLASLLLSVFFGFMLFMGWNWLIW